MPKYNAVLLDLDGTVIDSAMGVFNGIEAALSELGAKADRSTFYRFMGPPLRKTFAELLGEGGDIERAVNAYRAYYAKTGVNECTLYPGMEAALKTISKAGIKICLATSKPEEFAKIILKNLGIAQYFAFIGGATMDDTRCKKSDVIEYVLQNSGVERENAVMIGDRDTDLLSAKECRMDSIGVLFGYGSNQELSECSPVYLASDASEMCRYICTENK